MLMFHLAPAGTSKLGGRGEEGRGWEFLLTPNYFFLYFPYSNDGVYVLVLVLQVFLFHVSITNIYDSPQE